MAEVVGLFAVILMLVSAPGFGADSGGLLAFAAAGALTLPALWFGRVRWRWLAAGSAAGGPGRGRSGPSILTSAAWCPENHALLRSATAVSQLVFVSAPGARMTDDQFVAITRRALERLPQLPPYPR